MNVKRRFLVLGLVLLGLGIMSSWALWYHRTASPQSQALSSPSPIPAEDNTFSRGLSRGECGGSGTVAFTHLPMNLADVSTIQPYGIMVGAHVIPTSHGYFGPADYQSKRDQYPVYAIADGVIVNASHRGESVGDGPVKAHDEYQLWFEHSCSFYTYYDLLTSLSPELEQTIGKLTGFENKNVRIPVKAGQQVGRIGGQTVDFGVWNFEKTPDYFANPQSYEEDRPYLDDMFKYFIDPLKSQLLAKAARVAEPQSGKVNYDIAGKLVGGWFKDGSGGFQGPPGIQQTADRRYWDGHLAIAYDYVDPTALKFSIGNWPGGATQFGIKGNAPDPATVGVDTGLIKYELVTGGYVNGDTGQPWRFEQPIAKPQFKTNDQVQGTALLQLTSPDTLKVELFPEKTADQVNDFTSAAQLYVR